MRQQQQPPQNTMEQDFIAQMEALKNMPNMPNMPSMPMGMGNMNMMGNGMNMMGGMNGFNPMMGGMNMNMNMPNMQQMPMNMPMNMNMNMPMPMMGGMGGFNPAAMQNMNGANGFAFGAQQQAGAQFNDAYDRQPVNPNRQRGRKPRAPDYRYL